MLIHIVKDILPIEMHMYILWSNLVLNSSNLDYVPTIDTIFYWYCNMFLLTRCEIMKCIYFAPRIHVGTDKCDCHVLPSWKSKFLTLDFFVFTLIGGRELPYTITYIEVWINMVTLYFYSINPLHRVCKKVLSVNRSSA